MNNIDLSQDIYSDAEVRAMLERNRTVRYEFLVRDTSGNTIGALTNASGSISFDSTQEVMRTCSLTALKSEILDINAVDERIVPYFCLLAPNNHWLKYPLGTFLINPSERLSNRSAYVTVEGYDLAKMCLDVSLEDNYLVSSGTVYTSAITQLVAEIYDNYTVEADSTLTRTSDKEYEIGTSQLTVINDMLDAINYFPLYFDDYGNPIAEPFIFPEMRTIQMSYQANDRSVMFDGVQKSSDLFEIPNRFIRYTDDADSDRLRSVYTVTDESIISSTVNRGRVITDVQSVSDVASQTVLDSLVRRAALTASQVTETISFDTLNMPGHGYRNCLRVTCEDLEIDDKYIEYAWEMELSPGGKMHHSCNKAVMI